MMMIASTHLPRPAPPTQQILERFISAARVWSIFAQGLEEAVHEDYLDKAGHVETMSTRGVLQ